MEEQNVPAAAPDPAPVPAQAAAQPAQVKPSRTRLWLKAIAALYAVSLAFSFTVISKVDSAMKSRSREMDLSKLTGLGAGKKDAVAVIPVFGAIYQTDSSKIWERGSQQIARRIKSAAAKKEVKAILLDINSPGGSVGAVQEIYSAILRAKAGTGKPFVARFGDVSASGGYYVASACDKIVAEPGTITGSIGVIFSASSFAGLMNKVGMRNEVIKSGKFKDIGSPMRDMTPEERKLLQTLIDDSYEQFVAAVSEGRRIPAAEVKTLADGRIYTGRQALKNRLVDKLGDLQDALDLAGELSHIGKDPRIYRDADPIDQFFSILDSRLSFFSGASLEKAINSSPRLEYRWYGI
ncbi:MAG: signal peptide peptidase SppA [Elusimicrobiales bacterium]|jgi:protease-4